MLVHPLWKMFTVGYSSWVRKGLLLVNRDRFSSNLVPRVLCFGLGGPAPPPNPGKSALVTRLIFEKNQFSLQFFHSLLQVYIVYRVAFIFHLNAFLVLGFAYLLCWPSGRGIGLVCTRRFSFHELLIFNFFSFLENLFITHDIYPHPRPTILYPQTTTHDI